MLERLSSGRIGLMKYSDWQLDFLMMSYDGYLSEIYCGLSMR